MSFETELLNNQFQTNLVLKIGSDWYANDQVDSDTLDLIGTGLGIPVAHVGLVQNVKVNPIQFEIKNINSTTQTLTFELLDKDGIISGELGASPTAFLELPVLCYAGFITGSFDFQDYKLISETTITKIQKRSNLYSFNAKEVVSLLDGNIFDTVSSLNGAISNSATALTLIDAGEFPNSGMLKIEDEFIVYTGKSGNNLTGLSRGDLSSLAVAHDDQVPVSFVYATGDINPITLLLQIMVSPGGGGTYDVLDDGLGIDQNKIDIATFEDIRDTFFPSEQFRFYLYEIGKASDFIQKEILLATNCRVFAKEAKISVSILDQVTFSTTTTLIDENSISALPSWAINSDNVINQIIINYAYSEGEKKYSRQFVATDSSSISTYGPSNALTYNFKGIAADLNGAIIAQNRATRLLSRLSTPQAEIQVATLYDKSNINIGENVNLVHRYIPQQGSGLGINAQLEVISRSVDFGLGKAEYKLAYTSYANLRIGLIAPASQIQSITDQSTFDIPSADTTAWGVGYKVVLFNTVTNTFESDPVNEILSIIGDTVTMVSAFSTTLTIDHMIRFADYDQVIDEQRNKYAFVGDNSGFFGDGLKSYQIVF